MNILIKNMIRFYFVGLINDNDHENRKFYYHRLCGYIAGLLDAGILSYDKYEKLNKRAHDLYYGKLDKTKNITEEERGINV